MAKFQKSVIFTEDCLIQQYPHDLRVIKSSKVSPLSYGEKNHKHKGPTGTDYYQSTVGHGSECLPGATHPKNDPPYQISKFWYIGGILVKEASL